MTLWILFILVLEPNRYYVSPQSVHSSMSECFEARDYFIGTAPKPKINYEAVCIQTNKVEMR